MSNHTKSIDDLYTPLEQLALLQAELGLDEKAFRAHVHKFFDDLIPFLDEYYSEQ